MPPETDRPPATQAPPHSGRRRFFADLWNAGRRRLGKALDSGLLDAFVDPVETEPRPGDDGVDAGASPRVEGIEAGADAQPPGEPVPLVWAAWPASFADLTRQAAGDESLRPWCAVELREGQPDADDPFAALIGIDLAWLPLTVGASLHNRSGGCALLAIAGPEPAGLVLSAGSVGNAVPAQVWAPIDEPMLATLLECAQPAPRVVYERVETLLDRFRRGLVRAAALRGEPLERALRYGGRLLSLAAALPELPSLPPEAAGDPPWLPLTGLFAAPANVLNQPGVLSRCWAAATRVAGRVGLRLVPAGTARPTVDRLLAAICARNPDALGGDAPGEDFYAELLEGGGVPAVAAAEATD